MDTVDGQIDETWTTIAPGRPGRPSQFDARGFEATLTDAQCYDEQELKLPRGRRAGTGGLQAEVRLEPRVSRFCEGDQATITLQTNQAARVRLYSVDDSGHALQIYPYAAELDDQVNPTAPVEFPTEFFTLDGVRTERLVLVAIPSDGTWGPEIADRACKMPGLFRVDALPTGAAIHTISYRVSKNPEACATGDRITAGRSQMRQVFETLPSCE